jgi:hypothetical protein
MDFGRNLALKTSPTPAHVQSAQRPFGSVRVVLDSSDRLQDIGGRDRGCPGRHRKKIRPQAEISNSKSGLSATSGRTPAGYRELHSGGDEDHVPEPLRTDDCHELIQFSLTLKGRRRIQRCRQCRKSIHCKIVLLSSVRRTSCGAKQLQTNCAPAQMTLSGNCSKPTGTCAPVTNATISDSDFSVPVLHDSIGRSNRRHRGL